MIILLSILLHSEHNLVSGIQDFLRQSRCEIMNLAAKLVSKMVRQNVIRNYICDQISCSSFVFFL